MASEEIENVQEDVNQAIDDDYYDQETFASLKCSQLFDRLRSKNITKERGNFLKILKRWPIYMRGWVLRGGSIL